MVGRIWGAWTGLGEVCLIKQFVSAEGETPALQLNIGLHAQWVLGGPWGPYDQGLGRGARASLLTVTSEAVIMKEKGNS